MIEVLFWIIRLLTARVVRKYSTPTAILEILDLTTSPDVRS